MNLAWRKTELSNFVLNKRNVICKTIHYKEVLDLEKTKSKFAYFFKKVRKKIKAKNFIWLNLSQIKKLNLKKEFKLCKNNFIYDLKIINFL